MANVIDVESINKTKQKINMYNKEEALKIESINTKFSSINSTLKITPSSNLEDIQSQLSNKLKTIKRIHSNNETILSKNVIKYIEAASKANRIFNNINKG